MSCHCSSLPKLLVSQGLFPTAPSQPRLAISIEFLAFYRALFERSCDAINALALALNAHYVRRGYRMTNHKVRMYLRLICCTDTSGLQGETIHEPFRRSLGHAVQWFDMLQLKVDSRVEHIIASCRDRILSAQTSSANLQVGSISQANPLPPEQTRCAPILIQRCPACFGGKKFGTPLEEGCDIHVAADGNFHHRHRRSAGDGPAFYDPVYILPKSQVDAVGRRIQEARKRAPTKIPTAVPDEAIDQCQHSYEAADEKKKKTDMEIFDDGGLMEMVCRHDIPLFFANIDTPGEQQKYAVTLIKHLFSLLPSNATVTVLYDVGCVLARTLRQVSKPYHTLHLY